MGPLELGRDRVSQMGRCVHPGGRSEAQDPAHKRSIGADIEPQPDRTVSRGLDRLRLVPHSFGDIWRDLGGERHLDPLRRTLVHAQGVRKDRLAEILNDLERLVERRQPANSVDGEGADLLIGRHVGEEV